MADDEIAVTIEDDAAPASNGEDKGGAAEPVDDLKAQVADLKAGRQREADRAAAAERAAALARNQAQEAAVDAANARKEAAARSGESIDSGISAANEAIEAAVKEIRTAGEAGDFAAQAQAQAKLARASARLERLSEQKTDAEVRKTEAARPRQETRREETATADPFEAMLADMAQNGAARSADWIRQHRDIWSDDKKNAKVRAAHFDAVGDGIAPESDEYFEFIEKRVGLRQADAKTEETRVAVRPHNRRPPVAPVAESGGGMNGGSGTTVRLTQGQAKAATDGTLQWNYDDPTGKNRFKKGDPIGVQEMARRVHEQTKQGLYDPNNISA